MKQQSAPSHPEQTAVDHETLVANDIILGLRGELRTLQEKALPASQAELAVAEERISELQEEVLVLRDELAAERYGRQQELDNIFASTSWRIGSAVLAPLTLLRGRRR